MKIEINNQNIDDCLIKSKRDYNIMYNVGKCKYLVNYHNGVKTHQDGSKFYDIAIFMNKQKMNKFIKKLEAQGYKGD